MMARGYLVEECPIFHSRYFSGVKTQENKLTKNEDKL